MFFLYRLVFNLIYARSTNCAIEKLSERKSMCKNTYACYYSHCIERSIKTTCSRSASVMRETSIEVNKVDGSKRIVVNYLHTTQQKHFILCTRPKIKVLKKAQTTQTHTAGAERVLLLSIFFFSLSSSFWFFFVYSRFA